ncbi:MAG: tRNA (adenosine(37)-N6)-threonylcarbamoyltransferase complex dimerization subunit type 1 TsaB [Proteobacteria bacterium]|nr:tRNA (adenosine(37)-N6)-threonylcarbamoyltransferase complex dimerization subunit type 1 TsaB [Pseudomonadota bacterium]
MKLLALDTSSDACSVALQVDNTISETHVVEPKQHTRLLIPMIRDLLRDADIELGDLDAVVLGNGPGSFIGMRIAASVAQGLAFGSGLKIVPVSSMAAIAAEVMEIYSAAEVIVAQDARMNEAYLGIYRNDGEGIPTAVTDEVLQPIEKIDGLAATNASELFAAGQAWKKYPALLELNRAAISEIVDVQQPKAKYLLGLATRAWQAGEAIEPENLAPAYIRSKVAEKPLETRK